MPKAGKPIGPLPIPIENASVSHASKAKRRPKGERRPRT
jgi:hypothetical protein